MRAILRQRAVNEVYKRSSAPTQRDVCRGVPRTIRKAIGRVGADSGSKALHTKGFFALSLSKGVRWIPLLMGDIHM